MEAQFDEILKEFQVESKRLVVQALEVLEKAEGDIAQARDLEDYGMYVDRIMGGAKSLAVSIPQPEHIIHKIGDYSALCKAVGYKSSQVWDNETLYDICVAVLADATDILADMIDELLARPGAKVEDFLDQHLIDRLRWLSEQFGSEYRESVDVNKKDRLKQGEIDDLLAKLGLS